MSSKKRVSVSPASVVGLKRQFSFDASENLQCLICQDLVVDAVQVTCCGALHCRACISKCDRCPQCRKHVDADRIVPDVRCERLAAAYVRPCPNAQHGCDFNGNRASVTAHEEICDFVPRSVLREKIQAVELEIHQQATVVENLQSLVRLQRQQTQADERTKLLQQFALEKSKLQQQFALEKSTDRKKLQTAMMRCALGSEPAEAALRVLYDLPGSTCIAVVDREKAKGKREVLECYNRQIITTVHELNHNVAVWFRKASYYTPTAPGTSLRFVLLHPYDTALSKEHVFDASVKLNELSYGREWGWPNFMTSKELDDYTVNGKYYMHLETFFDID
jgi:hypothetical protein